MGVSPADGRAGPAGTAGSRDNRGALPLWAGALIAPVGSIHSNPLVLGRAAPLDPSRQAHLDAARAPLPDTPNGPEERVDGHRPPVPLPGAPSQGYEALFVGADGSRADPGPARGGFCRCRPKQRHTAEYQEGEAVIRYRFHPRYSESVVIAGRNRLGTDVVLIIPSGLAWRGIEGKLGVQVVGRVIRQRTGNEAHCQAWRSGTRTTSALAARAAACEPHRSQSVEHGHRWRLCPQHHRATIGADKQNPKEETGMTC